MKLILCSLSTFAAGAILASIFWGNVILYMTVDKQPITIADHTYECFSLVELGMKEWGYEN